MKTKENYMRPEVEIIDVRLEGVIAASGEDRVGITDDAHDGGMSRSKRRGLWDE